ncbi:MAG: hypothetical protein NVS4B8_07080 [Herpetosiphon sp.]
MAVTSRDLHRGPIQQDIGIRQILRHNNPSGILPAQWDLWRLAALFAGIFVLALVLSGRGQIMLDDLRYGRPRTMQLSAMVGHNEGAGVPTHIAAMNINRRVVVIELPGGDPNKAQILQGPYLFGADEDLTPVRLQLRDINHDNKPALVINVKNEEIIYMNTGDNFRLQTPAERQAMETKN